MSLSAKQMLAVELLADPTNTDTHEQMAKQCKVHRHTFRKWRLLDKDFGAALDKRTTELVRAGRHEAYRCLMHLMRKNDRASAHTFLQACGDIGTGGSTQVVNVTQTTEPLEDRAAAVLAKRDAILAENES